MSLSDRKELVGRLDVLLAEAVQIMKSVTAHGYGLGSFGSKREEFLERYEAALHLLAAGEVGAVPSDSDLDCFATRRAGRPSPICIKCNTGYPAECLWMRKNQAPAAPRVAKDKFREVFGDQAADLADRLDAAPREAGAQEPAASNFAGTVGAIPTQHQTRLTDEEALAAYNAKITPIQGDQESQHGTADLFIANILKQAGYPQLAAKYLLDTNSWWYA